MLGFALVHREWRISHYSGENSQKSRRIQLRTGEIRQKALAGVLRLWPTDIGSTRP